MSEKKYWLTRNWAGYELYLSVIPPRAKGDIFLGPGRIFFVWPHRFHALSKIRLRKKECIQLTGKFEFERYDK